MGPPFPGTAPVRWDVACSGERDAWNSTYTVAGVLVRDTVCPRCAQVTQPPPGHLGAALLTLGVSPNRRSPAAPRLLPTPCPETLTIHYSRR